MIISVLLELEHAASTWTCNIDMGMQHGHGFSACTGTWSKNMDMQYVLGHPAWTCTCSVDMNMQHG
jgi:hypothetical protein